MSCILLIIGLILLVKGADYFIDGSVELAAISGLSPLFIGLSVTAIGTTSPEAAVSIKAALSSHPSISFGNVIGSVIANIGFVIGLGAMIWTLKSKDSTIKREIPFSLAVIILILVLVSDNKFTSREAYLSRIDGIILISLFATYLFYLYLMAKRDRKLFHLSIDPTKIKHSKKEIFKASALTIAGISGVLLGAHLVVSNAIIIAQKLSVSEFLISITIIALGTSLPEAATSLSAMKKGEPDIAVGNIVGSNILNILFILGTCAIIRPLKFPIPAFRDLLIAAGLTAIFLVFSYINKKISRKEGGLLLFFYLLYIIFAIIRK
jgi:cation:H+ antiporter